MKQALLLLSAAVFLVGGTADALAQHIYKESRRKLRDGKYEESVTLLNKKIANDPQESEWVAQLAFAQAQLGNTEQAMAALRKAVTMGVAPERFVAEAHNLLEPLSETAAFREWLSEHGSGVIHGPMLGALTDRSARVWIRTAGEATVYAVAERADGDGDSVKSKAKRTGAASDFTAVLELTGLAPETEYRYRVDLKETEGREFKQGPGGRFRTPPSPGTPVKFDLAFGGGAGYVPDNERMWKTIAAYEPDALFLLGDNVYIDMPEHRDMQRFCYYRRHAVPQFRKLIADRPVYTIWDDHDFGTNDCWGGPQVARPPWKPEVWEVFRQNWNNPGYGGGRERPGCWYDFRIGDVHFIMLDCRYYRTNPGTSEPTMLGPVQKAWLKETVESSPATFKVLVSSVPWDFRTKGNSKDTWNGYRGERAEIFSFLAKHRIDGVVLMSADRHRSDAWRIERPDAYDLYEFNSSRLTNQHVHGTKEAAIFSYNKKQSFGLVTFDTTRSDPRVTYEVVTINGETVHTLELSLSRLSHPDTQGR